MKKSLIAVLISAGLIGAPAALTYSGFCWSKPGWLSYEEKMNIAEVLGMGKPDSNYIDSVISDSSKIDKFEKEYQGIRYKSLAEFKEKNPNCCKILSAHSTKPVWVASETEHLFGYRAAVIEAKFTARFVDKKGKLVELKNYTEYAVITNCGEVINRY